MGASMTLDKTGLDDLLKKFNNPDLKREIEKIPERGAVTALVAQAIADNFNQEGPGWAPLKASTIRRSVGKQLAKKLAKMSDRELLAYEAKHKKSNPQSANQPNRRILRKTGMLMKSVTVPDGAHNIHRVEKGKLIWGTDLAYAAVHNYGYPPQGIPKREFLTVRAEWMERLKKYVVEEAFRIITEKIVSGDS